MVKEITDTITKLAETPHLMLVLLVCIGTVGLAFASIGGWPQYNIPAIEPFWRYVLGACGITILSVVLVSVFAKEFRINEKPIDSNKAKREIVEKADIAIKQPADGDHVEQGFQVYIEYKIIPEGYQLWLFGLSEKEEGVEYYPRYQIKPRGGRWPTNGGHWSVKYEVGSYKEWDNRKFAVFFVGNDGQNLIRCRNVFGQALDKIEPVMKRPWPGLTALTSDTFPATETRQVTLLPNKGSSSAT
jgi:hypothetical protein